MRRIRVTVVGLMPEFFNMCAACQGMDWLRVASLHYPQEQLREYPPEVVEEQERAVEVLNALVSEFGPAVEPVTVDAYSPQGLWLSLRHRLGRGPAVIVGGRRVVRQLTPEAACAAVREELRVSA
ncbi:MAG: hypothetical protein IRZ26_04320 [Clostridia bacterium]|jgi:hypothetical protein|nr:hypothetical protein [Clostridia bacterium]MCL6521589.1 hypothetical protein [Bacillota bacterium]